MDAATRRGGVSTPRKEPNKANSSQPQISRPQRVNLGWIRDSLCKTNPISGSLQDGTSKGYTHRKPARRQARPTLESGGPDRRGSGRTNLKVVSERARFNEGSFRVTTEAKLRPLAASAAQWSGV